MERFEEKTVEEEREKEEMREEAGAKEEGIKAGLTAHFARVARDNKVFALSMVDSGWHNSCLPSTCVKARVRRKNYTRDGRINEHPTHFSV